MDLEAMMGHNMLEYRFFEIRMHVDEKVLVKSVVCVKTGFF